MSHIKEENSALYSIVKSPNFPSLEHNFDKVVQAQSPVAQWTFADILLIGLQQDVVKCQRGIGLFVDCNCFYTVGKKGGDATSSEASNELIMPMTDILIQTLTFHQFIVIVVENVKELKNRYLPGACKFTYLLVDHVMNAKLKGDIG